MKFKNVLVAGLVLGATAVVANLSVATAAPVQQQSTEIDPKIPFDRAWEHDDGRIQWRGKLYGSWDDLRRELPVEQWRCGAPYPIQPGAVWAENHLGEGGIAGATVNGNDCSMTLSSLSGGLYTYSTANGNFSPTNPLGKIEIPVVFHVIRNTAGTQGDVSDTNIANQIARLNTDYAGGTGAAGGPNPSGVNTGISFRLVQIIRYNNTAWYNDSGDYYTTTAWDTSRFLNIYSNTAAGLGPGTLGYVSGFAAEGCQAGNPADRIVLLSQVVGNNLTIPAPLNVYNLGRTAVHESGHYFGLFHTFQDGCGAASLPGCYENNDLICDTLPEQDPHFGCAAQSTCGDADPINNFMDYSDDTCMTQFTAEQSQRARCTLLTWRRLLAHTPSATNGPTYINATQADSAVIVTWGTTTTTGAGTQIGFQIQRKLSTAADVDASYTTLDGNLSASTLTYIDIDASPFLMYDYRVRAKLTATTFSNWTGGARGSVGFTGPTDVVASDFDYSDRVEITWTAPVGYTPTAYRILRGEQGGGCAADLIATVPADSTIFNDTTAVARTLYEYTVQAEVASGAPSYGDTDGGARAIPAPYNLLASGEIGGSTPPSTNRIQLSWLLPNLQGNANINRIFVYRSTDGGPLEQVASLNFPATQWSDTSVFSDVQYDYSVRLFSALLGVSGYSNSDLGFALESPAVTSATDGTAATVTVRWSAPTSWRPVSYSIWRKPQGRDPWPDTPLATDLPSTASQFVDNTAVPGVLYVYAVTGRSGTFLSSSERGRVDTGYPTILPPTNVLATDGTLPAFVRITWTPAGATTGVSWQVFRRVKNTNTAFALIKTVTTPVYNDSTATQGVIYEYYVKTRLSNGALSAQSNIDAGYR